MSELFNELSKHTKLTKKGKSYTGACINRECGSKDAFSYSVEKDFYYCFSCKISGKTVSWLNRTLNIQTPQVTKNFKGHVLSWIEKDTKNHKKYLAVKIDDEFIGHVWVSSFKIVDTDYFTYYIKEMKTLIFNCTAKTIDDKTFYNLIEIKEVEK